MNQKSTLVRSKSSNSGISKKSREERKTQSDKKSRSNADFPHHGLKKRGVYVEKRLAKPNLANGKKDDIIARKAPSRPRPGQKKFLASVLTILSQSTTGTQCPEIGEHTPIDVKHSHKDKDIGNKTRLNYSNAKGEYNVGSKVNDARNNKNKFKSKVLNKACVREDRKKMVVLQSKKEIVQTPSNYSEWSYRDASQKSNTSNYLSNDEDEHVHIATDLKNAIMEGRNVRKLKKLRYLEDEPKTLVADPPNAQKNLYNFFVDLLETTISAYNLRAEYGATKPVEDSKTELQINESAGNNLNIDKASKKTKDVIPSPLHGNIENDYNNNYDYINMEAKPLSFKLSREEVTFKRNKLKKNKAESFIYANKTKIPQKSKSVEINRKTKFKNKNDLIKALKQELELDTNVFEEPQSIFQALKVMARNKKKISFAPKTFTDECVIMQPKVISSRKGKKNKNAIGQNSFGRAKSIFNTTDYKYEYKEKYRDGAKSYYSGIDSLESSHSLEVYGLDYDSKEPTTTWNRPKDVTLTYHSSNSDLDFDVNDIMLNPTKSNSSNRLSLENI